MSDDRRFDPFAAEEDQLVTFAEQAMGMSLLEHQKLALHQMASRDFKVDFDIKFDARAVQAAFAKIGERARTAAEAARNFNLAYQGTNMGYRSYNPATQRAERATGNLERARTRRARCQQTYHTPTRAERAEEHRIRMNAKRSQRASATPGFTPVANAKITQAYMAARTFITKRNPHLTPRETHNEAINHVRAQLPARRRDYFELRPDNSKQAWKPGYCKPNVQPKAARQDPRSFEVTADAA